MPLFLFLEKMAQGNIFGQDMFEQPPFEQGKHELIAALESLVTEVVHLGQQEFVCSVVISQPGITIPLHECVLSGKMLGSGLSQLVEQPLYSGLIGVRSYHF